MSSIVGSIDSKKNIHDESYKIIGRISNAGYMYNNRDIIAIIDLQGNIYDGNKNKIAKTDILGNIHSKIMIKDWPLENLKLMNEL